MMKWFKHHTDMSMNDKIGKLEAEHGLVGYAVYLKILELCAMNWDEISEPKFSFSSVRIKSLLNLKSTRTELILSYCSTLNLFLFFKIDKEYYFEVPKLAEIKKRYEKKHAADAGEPRGNRTPNKKGEGDNKKGEGEEEEIKNTSERVSQNFVINLFNEKIAGRGNVKTYPSFSMSPNMANDFKNILGFPDFQTKEQWENYFNEISKASFLTKNGTCTLPWVLNSNNAFKVLSGQYQDRGAEGFDWSELNKKYGEGVSA